MLHCSIESHWLLLVLFSSIHVCQGITLHATVINRSRYSFLEVFKIETFLSRSTDLVRPTTEMINQARIYAEAGLNTPVDVYLGNTQNALFTDNAANKQEAQSTLLDPHFTSMSSSHQEQSLIHELGRITNAATLVIWQVTSAPSSADAIVVTAGVAHLQAYAINGYTYLWDPYLQIFERPSQNYYDCLNPNSSTLMYAASTYRAGDLLRLSLLVIHMCAGMLTQNPPHSYNLLDFARNPPMADTLQVWVADRQMWRFNIDNFRQQAAALFLHEVQHSSVVGVRQTTPEKYGYAACIAYPDPTNAGKGSSYCLRTMLLTGS